MGRYRIPPDAWRQATLALLRYPETRQELADAFDLATTRNPERDKGGAKPAHPDPTGTAGIRLANSAKYQRLKREITAVESATADLDPAELSVIRERFWKHKKGVRTPCPYYYIPDIGYSERQMHRICRKVILRVALNLGEIE